MAKKPQTKLTHKEIMNILQGMHTEIIQLQQQLMIHDKVQNDYITFKEDDEDFKVFLKGKYELADDRNNKEAEEK